MKLQFLRFEQAITIDAAQVSVLEILDRRLYSRMVASLLSEMGTSAVEPYTLWDESGKELSPKKALVVINTLPILPCDNRTLLAKLQSKVSSQLEMIVDAQAKVEIASSSLLEALENLSTGFWGTYAYDVEWSPSVFLKAFGFAPAFGDDDSLLDNCIRYLELCTDVDYEVPTVLVGAKNFLDRSELEKLFEQSVFLGRSLLLLESSHDEESVTLERKEVIDQDYLVDY